MKNHSSAIISAITLLCASPYCLAESHQDGPPRPTPGFEILSNAHSLQAMSQQYRFNHVLGENIKSRGDLLYPYEAPGHDWAVTPDGRALAHGTPTGEEVLFCQRAKAEGLSCTDDNSTLLVPLNQERQLARDAPSDLPVVTNRKVGYDQAQFDAITQNTSSKPVDSINAVCSPESGRPNFTQQTSYTNKRGVRVVVLYSYTHGGKGYGAYGATQTFTFNTKATPVTGPLLESTTPYPGEMPDWSCVPLGGKVPKFLKSVLTATENDKQITWQSARGEKAVFESEGREAGSPFWMHQGRPGEMLSTYDAIAREVKSSGQQPWSQFSSKTTEIRLLSWKVADGKFVYIAYVKEHGPKPWASVTVRKTDFLLGQSGLPLNAPKERLPIQKE